MISIVHVVSYGNYQRLYMSREKITISNGLNFHKIELTGPDYPGIGELRLFVPDWNQILRSDDFYKPLKEINPKNEDFSASLSLLVEYYQYLTLLPPGKSHRLHPYDKLIRKFDINSLLYLPEFNKELRQMNADNNLDRGTIYNYIKSQGDREKQKMVAQIRMDMDKGFFKTETESIDDLLKTAFYMPNQQAQPYTPYGYQQFIHMELQKVANAISHFSKKQRTEEYCPEADYNSIIEILKIDELIQFLSDDFDIKKLVAMASDALSIMNWSEDVATGRPKAKLRSENMAPQGYDNEETGKIMGGIITRLNEILVEQKKEQKRTRIRQIIVDIEHHLNLPLKHRWVGLIHIKNLFADQTVARKILLREIEQYLRFCLREHAKKSLGYLIKEYNLSQPEIRLYIMHNIGVPSLRYQIPLFEAPLYSFFSISKHGLLLFIEVILKKCADRPNDREILETYLKWQFISFLKYYRAYILIVQESEREGKRSGIYRYNKKSAGSRKKSDIDSDIHEDTGENESFADIMSLVDTPENESFFYSGDFEKEVEQVHSDDFGEELVDFNDFLEKSLTSDEIILYRKIVEEGLTEQAVAIEYGVSHTAINNRKKKLFEKIRRSSEFKTFANRIKN